MSTIRQQIILLLSKQECSARDLSQALHVAEKEVYQHLLHVARSMAAQRQKLRIIPSRCLSCGYVFAKRNRVTKPCRCPKCKGERMEEPRYRIA